MRRMIAISVLALFSTIAGNAQAQAQQANLQKLNVAYAFVATATTPLWIAEDEGLFKKNGLEIKMILFQGSAAATQALLGGGVDIVFGSAAAAITVVGRGVPLAVIATTHLLNYQLVSRPNVTSAEQLRGKTIGISAFSGGDDFALRRLLPKLGLTLDKDVKFVVLGTPNPYQKAEAVINGTADATLSSYEATETLKLQGKNMSVLAETLPNGIKLSVGDIYATRPYLKKSPETVKSFLRAYVEAIRMAKNDKQLVFKTLRKYTKIENEEILERIYMKTVVGEFLDVPYPHLEAIIMQKDDTSTNIPDLARLKDMRAEEFVDNGPMAALQNEGFFKDLPTLRTR